VAGKEVAASAVSASVGDAPLIRRDGVVDQPYLPAWSVLL
jgi:hypothetical protein